MLSGVRRFHAVHRRHLFIYFIYGAQSRGTLYANRVMLQVSRLCRWRRRTSWSALCGPRRGAHTRSHLLLAVLLGDEEGSARLQGLEHPRGLGMGSLVAAGGLAGAAFWLPVYPVRPTAPSLAQCAGWQPRALAAMRRTPEQPRSVM